MKPETIENVVHTTAFDLAAAFYETALAELGDEKLAERVAQKLTADALRRSKIETR